MNTDSLAAGTSAGNRVVGILLPSVLQPLAGGQSVLAAAVDGPDTVGTVLDSLSVPYPILARRLRDETGAVRRFVNIYLDGNDVRRLAGMETPVRAGQELLIIQSVAGG